MAKTTSKLSSYFSSEVFSFLKGLERHNNRDWFEANKERFLTVARDPFLKFIADFEPHLKRISSNFVADPRPVGGSLFRIYRDVRFSKDKRPYKATLGAHFQHQAAKSKESSVPGFYLHLQSGKSFAAAGMWHPDAPALTKVREAIVKYPGDWKVVRSKLTIEGDSLTRPSRKFDPNHPFIEDIKRKDFIVTAALSDTQVESPHFMEEYEAICKKQVPLVKFLTKALGLPW